jgi:hypothetical protein
MTSKAPGNKSPNKGSKERQKTSEAFEAAKWKKGESGNPNGRPPDPPALKKLKNLTKAELVDVGNMVIKGDHDALKKLAKAPKATVLQRMLASVAVKVIEKGDMHSLDILLNRMVGKVKDEVAFTGNVPQVVVNLPSNGREAKDENVKTTEAN